jgi:hypothetical protein
MTDKTNAYDRTSDSPPPGGASVTHGPHALTAEHMRKSSGRLPDPAPPPDVELHGGPVSQTGGDAEEARR